MLTPRVQIVASPKIRNLAIPNEDARAIDLEDTNLFALNRFPGYDRVEDGVRVTYGVDWQLNLPGWRVQTTIGQSYRLNDARPVPRRHRAERTVSPTSSGRTEVRYRDFLKLTHRFRLDKDSLAVRRNEVDATVGSDRTYVEVGYLQLNRDIDFRLRGLAGSRGNARWPARVAFARYWSVFGSAVVNLTDRNEDPTLDCRRVRAAAHPAGHRLCGRLPRIRLDLAARLHPAGDAQSGSSFRIYFNLRNLGFN